MRDAPRVNEKYKALGSSSCTRASPPLSVATVKASFHKATPHTTTPPSQYIANAFCFEQSCRVNP